jgi:hypothetical protein
LGAFVFLLLSKDSVLSALALPAKPEAIIPEPISVCFKKFLLSDVMISLFLVD